MAQDHRHEEEGLYKGLHGKSSKQSAQTRLFQLGIQLASGTQSSDSPQSSVVSDDIVEEIQDHSQSEFYIGGGSYINPANSGGNKPIGPQRVQLGGKKPTQDVVLSFTKKTTTDKPGGRRIQGPDTSNIDYRHILQRLSNLEAQMAQLLQQNKEILTTVKEIKRVTPKLVSGGTGTGLHTTHKGYDA